MRTGIISIVEGVSSCCRADVVVGGNPKHTAWYVCEACGQACDVVAQQPVELPICDSNEVDIAGALKRMSDAAARFRGGLGSSINAMSGGSTAAGETYTR